jgi:hypothetical protein
MDFDPKFPPQGIPRSALFFLADAHVTLNVSSDFDPNLPLQPIARSLLFFLMDGLLLSKTRLYWKLIQIFLYSANPPSIFIAVPVVNPDSSLAK